MRALLAATIFCLLFTLPAQARQRQQQSSCYPQHKFVEWPRHQRNEWKPCRGRHVSRDRWSHHIRRHYARVHNPRTGRGVVLPAPCRVAASMGGPCGCWAAHILLGRLDHVWHGINLWLADDWLRFPRAAPAPGTAAVWPHRHVAPVVAVHNDGTVTVRDSWAVHRVRMAGLVFVQPPSPRRRELIRFAPGSLS